MLLFAVAIRVLLLHLQLILITGHVVGRQAVGSARGPDPFFTSTESLSLPEEEEASGEPEPVVFNTTVFPDEKTSDSLPHLVVKDASGHPCLLATLNATMQVSYRVPEGIVHETYIALAEIQLPEDVHAQGACGENTTRLLLDWGNNTFHVNMTFTRNEPTKKQENATWSMTDLALSYDLSNQDVFPGTSDTDVVTIDRTHLNMFTTPVGSTYWCNHKVKVLFGTNDRGVVVNFHDVKLAPFGVASSEFPTDVNTCTRKEESEEHEEILIPLIVASCLSAIVVIIVISYAISRKLQASRDQSQYKQMP